MYIRERSARFCYLSPKLRSAYSVFLTHVSTTDESVGFEVIPVVVMKSSSNCACYLLRVNLFLGLFFDPEGGGDIFLRNVG
jgi:hypothetical protein